MRLNLLMILLGAACSSAWWAWAATPLRTTPFIVLPLVLTAGVAAVTIVETINANK